MQRPDIKAAEAQIRAAERTLAAARAERLPSLSLNADYGVIGTNPAQSHGTFSVAGTLRIPHLAGRPHGRRYRTGECRARAAPRRTGRSEKPRGKRSAQRVSRFAGGHQPG